MSNQFWSLLSISSLWGWIFLTIGLIINVFKQRDIIVRKKAISWGIGIVLSYSIWIIAMLNV
jgi:hypothetical protein